MGRERIEGKWRREERGRRRGRLKEVLVCVREWRRRGREEEEERKGEGEEEKEK